MVISDPTLPSNKRQFSNIFSLKDSQWEMFEPSEVRWPKKIAKANPDDSKGGSQWTGSHARILILVLPFWLHHVPWTLDIQKRTVARWECGEFHKWNQKPSLAFVFSRFPIFFGLAISSCVLKALRWLDIDRGLGCSEALEKNDVQCKQKVVMFTYVHHVLSLVGGFKMF